MLALRVHEGGELSHEPVPDPEADVGEVVVELRAAGLNRRDLLVSRGTYPYPLPFVPGNEGAGEVVAIGSGVTDFKVGDRGAYAGAVGGYTVSNGVEPQAF